MTNLYEIRRLLVRSQAQHRPLSPIDIIRTQFTRLIYPNNLLQDVSLSLVELRRFRSRSRIEGGRRFGSIRSSWEVGRGCTG